MSVNLQQRGRSFGRFVADESITGLSSVKSLTVPSNVTSAKCTAAVQALRYRFGTPTATVGHQLKVGESVEVFGSDMNLIKFIEETASGTLFVTYSN